MKSLIYKEEEGREYYCSIVNELDKMKDQFCIRKFALLMIMIMISLWDFEIKERKEDLFIDKLKKRS